MDKDKFVKDIDEVNEQRKKSKIVGPEGEVVQRGETAGERRSSSYAERVKRWWNSRLHGSVRRPDPEGEKKVLCIVRDRAGRVVARAEGTRTKKRSARGAARQAAVGKVFVEAKKTCAGKRARVDLSGMKFEYRVLEV